MTEYVAICSECDHGWIPNKPPDEIERPRCSECQAGGRSILFETTAEVADAVQRSAEAPEIVRDAMRERRWQEHRQRLEEILDRLGRTAPSDTDETAAREVRGPYWEVNKLRQAIDDRGPEISLGALDGVGDRLDELEAEIQEETPQLEIVDDLGSTIEELQEEEKRLTTRIEELNAEEEQLEEIIIELMQDVALYSSKLEGIEDEKEAFEQGHEAGEEWGKRQAMEEFRITVSCVKCGGEMVMKRGSDTHQAARQALLHLEWGHENCPEDGWVGVEDYSRM